MTIPAGYTELARIGFADKGTYAAGTTYRKGDVVYYSGSTYVALKDNLKGVTPTNDGVNWKYMARGFLAEKLVDVTAVDTSGVVGTAGQTVTGQALIDAIADRVMTKLLAKTNVVNNLLTTEAGFALDARQGKALKDITDKVNSDLSGLISSGELSSGTNLNNLVENSVHNFTTANSSTLINIPEGARGSAGILIVKKIEFVYQFLITRSDVVFIRSSWNNNGTYTWNNWSQK